MFYCYQTNDLFRYLLLPKQLAVDSVDGSSLNKQLCKQWREKISHHYNCVWLFGGFRYRTFRQKIVITWSCRNQWNWGCSHLVDGWETPTSSNRLPIFHREYFLGILVPKTLLLSLPPNHRIATGCDPSLSFAQVLPNKHSVAIACSWLLKLFFFVMFNVQNKLMNHP